MTRRPASWQAEKARTRQALRELPRCEEKGCDGKGMGWIGRRDHVLGEFMLLWVCPHHAAEAKRLADKKPAAAPRET